MIKKLLNLLKTVFLHKRMKSLYWRLGGMMTAEILAVLPLLLADFNVPQPIIIVVGLVIGEITKFLNNTKK